MVFLTEFFETEIFQYILRPIIYVALGCFTYKIITYFINRSLTKKEMSTRNKKRIETSKSIINNIIKYLIIIITFLFVLSSYHVDVSSLFAGLGIGVAVLSLAFQDIAKDFLAGISILIDEQFEVGDNVSINGFRGDVISIGLRTTRIRDYKGAEMILSNHSITEIINYSLNASLAEVDLSVSYDADTELVEATLRKCIEKMNETYTDLKGKIELWGIENLDDSAVIYRIAGKVKATKDFEIERKMRKDLKLALEEAGIEIPYPQIEVRHGK